MVINRKIWSEFNKFLLAFCRGIDDDIDKVAKRKLTKLCWWLLPIFNSYDVIGSKYFKLPILNKWGSVRIIKQIGSKKRMIEETTWHELVLVRRMTKFG